MHEKERHRIILSTVQDKPVVTVQELVELNLPKRRSAVTLPRCISKSACGAFVAARRALRRRSLSVLPGVRSASMKQSMPRKSAP